MAPVVAFVGMGLMGQSITANLVTKGNLSSPLILYNRTLQHAVNQSRRIGYSLVAKSLQEAVAKADIIWLCLQSQEAVEHTFAEIFSTADNSLTDKLFIESSTVNPDLSNNLAERVVEAGGEYVAMPVFGDPGLAAIGKLVCVPAGPPASVARILPFLENVIAEAVIDLSGEEPGKASLLKMIGNVMIMSTMEMVAEVNVFAEKSGLGREIAQKLIGTFPKAAGMIYSERMHSGEYVNGKPMADISKARVLTSSVLELARLFDVALPAYEVAVRHLAVVESEVGSSCDITSIYGAVRMESHLDFEHS